MIGASEADPPPPPGPEPPKVEQLVENLETAAAAAKEAREAQIRPETPQEPSAPTTAPEAPESHSGEIPARSEANRCACGDTGSIKGERCPFCEMPPCRFCGSVDEPRAWCGSELGMADDIADPRAECVDEKACAVRDAIASAPDGEYTPAPSDDPTSAPEACPLCHSSRATLVFVPPTHLEDSGQWRCQNGSACKSRQQLAQARESLGE